MLRVLGIDPGLDAFAAIYQPGASLASGLRWQFLDIPTRGEDSARRIDAAALRDWVRRFAPEVGYVENVGPMKGQGLGHTSRFLRACGSIEATVQCCDVDLRLVAPQTWKRYYEIPSYQAEGRSSSKAKAFAKAHSRTLALQLFPELASILTRVSDHGRAEAALLAFYGAKRMEPI